MVWNRSNALALATRKCTTCLGVGTLLGRNGANAPCDCVLRSIFRICHDRFRSCVEKEKYLSKVTLEIHSGPNRRGTWGRKDEEYIADFLHTASRILTEEEHKIFRYRFLLGADWRLCARKLGIDKGRFFHAIYRIQVKLGQEFAHMQPYSLFPLADYFCSMPLKQPVKALTPAANRVAPIRPPVRKPRSDDGLRKAA